MSASSLPVAVLGGGIIGSCAAAYLRRAGHEVLLIDRGDPREAASFGNAGCLNGSSIVPVAMPGVLRHVPHWLLDPEGPLVLRWRYLPRLLPWLARFVAAGTPERVAAQARALRGLIAGSVEAYRALAAEAGLGELFEQRGHLVAYTSEQGHAGDAYAMSLREANGIAVEEVPRAALRELEPDLAEGFLRARLIRETGHLSDPGAFVQGLKRDLLARGGRIVDAQVLGVIDNGARLTGVATSAGTFEVKGAVVALGAWSSRLAARLGDRVMLDTERGYHLEVPRAAVGPRIPTLWSEAKIFSTPMAGRVRCAGTVEFAGLDAPPDWRRCTLLARQLRHMYPALGAAPEQAAGQAELRWMGRRPSTPDSLPVIGRAARFENAVYAFGHGHIGLTAGAPTGRLVAQLLSGERPSIDLAPFSAARWR
ncbi:NAD(P)/FAD-dependent oxidoreductase [Burkholderia gladioli]|uniref:NAD(P)/FAD-dependent oxidoreductase n=1 Tax=Burkholderia gladioli TaxID=28095 RepID=UPI00163F902B|nr:FAD-dependent oxidoreductase [Burkholderia gladioli]